MRLTLRTLLAYLDDILSPEDSREIAQKIEESEFAKGLMHRARDVVRRLRLGAPSIGERGPGFDPNTVAEYLDNTLPSERVPDFEKICLESDVQLAEVASCHQILTMVLGEPAEVAPASRERMYDLPALLAAQSIEEPNPPAAAGTPTVPTQPTGTPVVGAAATPAASVIDDGKHRAKPIVPDYLREPMPGRRRLLPSLGALVLFGVLAVLLLAAFRQFEPGSWLANLVGLPGPAPVANAPQAPVAPAPSKDEVVPAAPTETAAKPTPDAKPAEETPAVAAKTPPAPAGKPVALPSAPMPPTPPVAQPAAAATVASPASAKPAAPLPPLPAEKPAPAASVVKVETPMPTDQQPKPGPMGSPAPTLPAAGASPVNPLRAEMAGKPELKPALPAPPDAAKPMLASSSPKPASPDTTRDAAPMPPERLGRSALDRQVLLEFEQSSGNWMRMAPQAVLKSSQPILSLPAYQPVLTLIGVGTVQLVGAAQLELLPTDSQGTSGLKISYGRVIVRPIGETKARLRLQVGARTGTITFKNADAQLGISVDRARAPGANPEESPGMLMADVFAASGDFTWEEGAANPPVQLAERAMLRVDADPLLAPTVMSELPRWLTTDETSAFDKFAARFLDEQIRTDRPVSLSLRELTNHRREEVAALAARSLGCLDEFDPMVTALNGAEQRAFWDEYMRSLQQAVNRGADTAAKVRLALEQRYPNHAPKLYRMLWGYTPKELVDGQGAILVGYLEHEMLVYRVMAYHNLEKLTGLKYAYRPQDPLPRRQQAVARWKERLQLGLLARPPEKPRKPEKPRS
jgi:hypothetical protein